VSCVFEVRGGELLSCFSSESSVTQQDEGNCSDSCLDVLL